VTISLQSGTPVKENSVAMLYVHGITGLKFVELYGGTSEAKTLKPKSRITAGTSVGGLTGQAEVLSVKMELLVNQLQELTGTKNQIMVGDILKRTGSIMNNVDRIINENSDQASQLLKNLSLASSKLAAMLEELHLTATEARKTVAIFRQSAAKVLDARKMGKIVDEVQGVLGDARRRLGTSELGKITKLLDGLVVRTTALVDRVDLVVSRSREDIRSSLRYLSEATENLKDFSRLIREDPSRLLRQQERRERVLP